MKSTQRWSIAAVCAVLVGCGGSSEVDVQKSLATTIPVTRSACTPFGNPPRPVQPVLDALFGPSCLGDGGQALDQWKDPNGSARQACLYEPSAASTSHKLPLVVFVHPSVTGTDISLAVSNIRQQLATADLTGDPQRPGFILLAPYGRVTARYYPFPDDGNSPGWDNWYRQLQPDAATRTVNGQEWPENVDAASIDHYLDEVLAQGKVDTSRVYIMGWSNGSAMATLYALNRPQFAAAAIYSSPDPFQAFDDPCPQTPVASTPADDTQVQMLRPHLPMYQVNNSCDIGGLCPNSRFLAQTLGSNGVTDMQLQIIDPLEQSTQECLAACGTDPTASDTSATAPLNNPGGYELGVANHIRWPTLWTTTMFDFLRDHPQ